MRLLSPDSPRSAQARQLELVASIVRFLPLGTVLRQGTLERLQRATSPANEGLEIGTQVPIGDCRDVELSGIGQGADTDRHVAHDGHDRKQLEHESPGEVQGDRRPWHIGHVRVHEPLTWHELEEGAGWMKTFRKKVPPCGRTFFFRSAVSAAILRSLRDMIVLADGEECRHPSVEVPFGSVSGPLCGAILGRRLAGRESRCR